MLNRVVLVALLAGLTAGPIVAGLQHFTTTPLILKAEAYERASSVPPGATASAAALWTQTIGTNSAGDVAAHSGHDTAEWSPKEGIERTAYTSLATVGTAIGFALILLAGMIAAGEQIDARRALGWGAAAFVASGLGPAMGLPPELPGSAAGDLAARQLWWILAAAATGTALWLIVRPWGWVAKVAGLLLLIAPHVAGAPHAEAFTSRVPAELAAKFAAVSLANQAALWLTVGYFASLFWSRTSRGASP